MLTKTAFALLLAATTAAPAQTPATLTGTVSDTMCGAGKHMMDGGAAKCVRDCVKAGDRYALVSGGKVYVLNGHSGELDKLAGQKVTVKGAVTGDTVQVASVTAAK